MDEPLILASASPIRKKLLAAAGLKVRVEPPLVDEEAIKRIFEVNREAAPDCALALAEAKAQEVAGHHQHVLVVGADQILVCGSTWFNKPADFGDARAQLQAARPNPRAFHRRLRRSQGCSDMAYRKLGFSVTGSSHRTCEPAHTTPTFSSSILSAAATAELDEQPGTRRLDEPAIVRGDCRINQLGPDGLQGLEGAALVHADQS